MVAAFRRPLVIGLGSDPPLYAGLADEPWLEIAKPDLIGPPIHRVGIALGVATATVVAAEDGESGRQSRPTTRPHLATSPRSVQISLQPAAKSLGMHRIFVGGTDRKYVIADTASKREQVYIGAFQLDADEHHRSFAPRTGGALKLNRWGGGQRALRLGHGDALLNVGASATLSITGDAASDVAEYPPPGTQARHNIG